MNLKSLIVSNISSDKIIKIRKHREILRYFKDKKDKEKLKNNDFSIFSSNCIGGVIYHSLGMKFLSPTINLWIKPEDFIKILQDPKLYLSPNLMHESKNNKFNYPVGNINGTSIYGEHYSSYLELQHKWNIRCRRINWNNIIVMMIQRDGCTIKDLYNFDRLRYKRKIVFTKKIIRIFHVLFIYPIPLKKWTSVKLIRI